MSEGKEAKRMLHADKVRMISVLPLSSHQEFVCRLEDRTVNLAAKNCVASGNCVNEVQVSEIST